MIIEPPKCNWIGLPYKDKRKGCSWRCKACGHVGGGKLAPECPCKPIEILPRSNIAGQAT